MHWTFPDVEPGVPYTVTVRASTAKGIGEPVSIIFFSVEQGKIDCRPCTKNCDVQNIELLKILYYVPYVLSLWCMHMRNTHEVIHTRLYTRGDRYAVHRCVESQL